MQNKLQELTDRLYIEGLSKGKQEGEELIKKAKDEASSIIASAQIEADRIIAEANAQAAQLGEKTANDLKHAADQALTEMKLQLVTAVTAKAAEEPVKSALADPEFIKSLIVTVVKAFNASDAEAKSLDLILPASMKDSLSEEFEKQIKAVCGAGLQVKYVKGMNSGFRIGPGGEGYIISFTGEDFASLIGQYLKPVTKKVLFG